MGIQVDLQLPSLIGIVSLLPFEPLPEAAQPKWDITIGASVTEKDERRDMRPRFGPFESLRMDLKRVIGKNNQQTTVPVTIEYGRLTDAKPVKLQAEREERQAELRRRTEEMARAEAERKRLAETSLTEIEKAAAMVTLGGSESAALIEALDGLAKKDLKEPDTEIAEAIERLLQHGEPSVREAAHRALPHWSLEYRPRGDLDR